MSLSRQIVSRLAAIVVATVVLVSANVYAQEADVETEDSSDEIEETAEIEEITVVADKPGDRKRVDEEYEDPIKAQLLKDFYQMKEDQEEYEWRKSATEDSSSRIQWGYDPADEYRMRNEMALQDLPSERTKPASIFKVNF